MVLKIKHKSHNIITKYWDMMCLPKHVQYLDRKTAPDTF